MDYDSLYYKLERLLELEEEFKQKTSQTSSDVVRLREYHQIASSLPILSPEDLIEYQRVVRENAEKEKTEEQSVEELADYPDSRKVELLEILKQKCSPSAYETIESIVNQIFS